MQKNFDVELKTLDEQPLNDDKTGKPLVARQILINALFTTFPHENLLDGDEKQKRFLLAMRLNQGGEQEIIPEELSLLKKLVGWGWSPLIVGQLYKILD